MIEKKQNKYDPKIGIFKSAAAAVREYNRRHRWSTASGGQYILRRPVVNALATLDTTGLFAGTGAGRSAYAGFDRKFLLYWRVSGGGDRGFVFGV